MPLLELLVRAADRFPDRLDHIEHLLRDLGDHGEKVLPDGFEDIWAPIWRYRDGQEARDVTAFDAAPVLEQLKDFQRATVDTVFDRFYGDGPEPRRTGSWWPTRSGWARRWSPGA